MSCDNCGDIRKNELCIFCSKELCKNCYYVSEKVEICCSDCLLNMDE